MPPNDTLVSARSPRRRWLPTLLVALLGLVLGCLLTSAAVFSRLDTHERIVPIVYPYAITVTKVPQYIRVLVCEISAQRTVTRCIPGAYLYIPFPTGDIP